MTKMPLRKGNRKILFTKIFHKSFTDRKCVSMLSGMVESFNADCNKYLYRQSGCC